MERLRKYVFIGTILVAAVARGEPRPAVIELFTSEGCSSCPPAEEFLAELAQLPNVLPLSFHVDYWNGLGWQDAFSLAAATRRQRVYAANLHRNSVFTPQAVIDGDRDFVGSNRGAILSSLRLPREAVPAQIAVVDGRIEIAVARYPASKAADILLIGYRREAITHIGRGENAGKTLQEFNVVRSIQRLGGWDGAPEALSLQIESLPADVTHVALILQEAGQGAILAAASAAIR